MIALNIYHYFIEKNIKRVRYIITLKSNTLDGYPHKYMKLKVNSDDDLSFKKHLFLI